MGLPPAKNMEILYHQHRMMSPDSKSGTGMGLMGVNSHSEEQWKKTIDKLFDLCYDAVKMKYHKEKTPSDKE